MPEVHGYDVARRLRSTGFPEGLESGNPGEHI
jgi:hypothetical protein